jgi:di/tricarboxylate transporter
MALALPATSAEPNFQQTILDPILADPILSKSRFQSLARLLPHVVRREFSAGDKVYRAKAAADHLYLLVSGTVHLESPEISRVRVESGHFGEESATDCEQYLTDAVAGGAVTALVIPRRNLMGLIATNPRLKTDLYFSLMNHFSGEVLTPPQATVAAEQDTGSWLRVAGWALTIALPGLMLAYGGRLGLDPPATIFSAIFSATLLMWTFNLVDDYIPGLFALLTTATLGLVPVPVVLSGFGSDGFFMAMSILGLGSVIEASGLTYRFLLTLLLRLPTGQFWQELSLLLTGYLITPVLPSVNGRVVLITPLLNDMIEILHFRPKGKAATRLANSAFVGASLVSAVFLSSKSVNFAILGLLSEQHQQQFQWLSWLRAASVTGAVMTVLYLVTSALMFRNHEPVVLPKEQVGAQLRLLGPIKNREWAAIAGIAIFMVGVVTSSIHHVSPPWLGLAILYGLLLFGFLRKHEFNASVDWPFLVYLGGLLGIINAFNYVGLDKWLGHYLAAFGTYMRVDFRLFILLMAGVLFALRLFIPDRATMVLAATVFMPLADANGVSPWVVGFVILVLGEVWILPYQCSHYGQFRDLSGGAADEVAMLRFNIIVNLIKLVALLASIPYWKALGLV